MRFQFVLKSATIALLFGSALPILYFVSAATLLLTYTIDKYLVLSHHFAPTATSPPNSPCPQPKISLVLLSSRCCLCARFCAYTSGQHHTTTAWPPSPPPSSCPSASSRTASLACEFRPHALQPRCSLSVDNVTAIRYFYAVVVECPAQLYPTPHPPPPSLSPPQTLIPLCSSASARRPTAPWPPC
jgi:hypothetical protein